MWDSGFEYIVRPPRLLFLLARSLGKLSGWECCRVGFDIIDARRSRMPKRFDVLRFLSNGQSGYVAFSIHRTWDHGGHRRP